MLIKFSLGRSRLAAIDAVSTTMSLRLQSKLLSKTDCFRRIAAYRKYRVPIIESVARLSSRKKLSMPRVPLLSFDPTTAKVSDPPNAPFGRPLAPPVRLHHFSKRCTSIILVQPSITLTEGWDTTILQNLP